MLSLKDIDPVLIVVAASALLLGVFLGYALRSYVSHRRRLRADAPLIFAGYRLTAPGAAGETKAHSGNDKPERHQITDGHPLRKAIFTIIIYGGTCAWMWFQYPACGSGHVAVFAPQTLSLWACAQGYSPAVGSASTNPVPRSSQREQRVKLEQLQRQTREPQPSIDSGEQLFGAK
jgi:hypothetical protein